MYISDVSRWLFFMYACLSVEKTYVHAKAGCAYNHKNYTACDLMFKTTWKPCNGTDCQVGLQQRGKGICCPPAENQTIKEIKENCKINCNLTDADFFESATYIPPSTTQNLHFPTTYIKGRLFRLIIIF
jgi:hypothetical protein